MGESSVIDPQLALSHKYPESTWTYTERDVALYALGIEACGNDAVDPDELKYVYHLDGQQHIQALLYRLSGDYNPLHSDPMIAKVAGAVIKCICKDDPNKVKSILGRFLLHVYPGETLITEMWLQGLRVIYQG